MRWLLWEWNGSDGNIEYTDSLWAGHWGRHVAYIISPSMYTTCYMGAVTISIKLRKKSQRRCVRSNTSAHTRPVPGYFVTVLFWHVLAHGQGWTWPGCWRNEEKTENTDIEKPSGGGLGSLLEKPQHPGSSPYWLYRVHLQGGVTASADQTDRLSSSQ